MSDLKIRLGNAAENIKYIDGTTNFSQLFVEAIDRIEALEAALRDVSDDLEAELNARYPVKYRETVPHEKQCFDRDMTIVLAARTLLQQGSIK